MLQLELRTAGVPTAEGINIPQLKRIIVVSGDKIAMEPIFNGVLNALFGIKQPKDVPSRQPELGQASKDTARGGRERYPAGILGKIRQNDGGAQAPAD